VGLFSRRRYAEGTVPDNVEGLDQSVFGPPPSSFPQRASYPAPSEPSEAGLDDEDYFYDDEDSEDRPSPEEQARPKFLPPPPTRRPSTPRRKVLVRFALFILVMMGVRTVDGALSDGDSDGPPTGWHDVPDVYADVAAEPDRSLNAQGIEFELLSNRPLDPAVCSFLDRCLAGAAAQWDVTGTGLTGRSWYLVFEDDAAADAAAGHPQLSAALTPGLPSSWAIRGASPGRFITLAGVGRKDDNAVDVRSDPTAVAAADALRMYSTEPAVIEAINR
jgi:hypothetical protein